MAGVTDLAFRLLVKRFGVDLVFTEMINARALLYGNRESRTLMKVAAEERPVAVQIFGSEPAVMARAARSAEEQGADIIDINMGCPTPKIVKNGEGAALLRDPDLAARIVASVVQSVRIPVTVKMRRGWDEANINGPVVARRVAEEGAAAVTMHGRTRSQGYSGRANWAVVAEVCQLLSIPVFGNGDIRSPEEAEQRIAETGCAGVMVGRAALGNPWLPGRIAHYLATGEILSPPPKAEVIRVALEHLDLLSQLKGERRAVLEMRKHAAWYIKGWPGAAQVREEINRCERRGRMEEVLYQFNRSQQT
ncbi:MAG: tRNA dihydrouridine synthase DusB [Firmicutes bacterium]|nr:tRNA dihydrouridine synthase DusB [Bacillota bacterium]